MIHVCIHMCMCSTYVCSLRAVISHSHAEVWVCMYAFTRVHCTYLHERHTDLFDLLRMACSSEVLWSLLR